MLKKVKCDTLSFPLMVAIKDDAPIDFSKLDNGIYYVIAKNGMHTVCKNNMYIQISKTSAFAGGLEEIKEEVCLSVPKIDRGTFDFMVRLFQSVYKKYQSEVNVLLYYKADTNKWFVRLPKQDVSGAHVTYELTEEDVWYCDGESVPAPEGAECFGTCHSHASMGAFFSATDDNDDKTNIGYQIVIGKVNSSAVETKCRLTMPGEKIDKKLEEVVADVTDTFQEIEVPEIVSKKTVTYQNGSTYSCEGYYDYHSQANTTYQKKEETKEDAKISITSGEMDITFVLASGKTQKVTCPVTTIKTSKKGSK